MNLDLPQADRWTEIVKDYKHLGPAIVKYLADAIPKWAFPIIEAIARDVRPYFHDYGEEMLGVAKAYDLDVGIIVAVNLVYQLESIGINCSNWNNTGPTTKDDPGCVDTDPSQKWCYCRDPKLKKFINPDTGILPPPKYQFIPGSAEEAAGVSGMCTSVVAKTPASKNGNSSSGGGSIMHGRNLDWNIPATLREMIIDIDFQRNNKTIFTGTGMAGFVGVFNGMVSGEKGWSVSLDARGKGGKLLPNLIQALLHKSMTPCQHIRKVLETGTDYHGAVSADTGLGAADMIDEAYFIVAGASGSDGGVMTRDRNDVKDFWGLNASDPDGWFRLQTNYDHWNPVPKADDRRTPGVAHMKAMGESGVDEKALLAIMEMYPTFNFHTDYTAIMDPATGLYDSGVWL